MDARNALLLPLGLGLLGFFEPCSLGINLIFLRYLAPLTPAARVRESLAFCLARAGFLGIVGAAAGWFGTRILVFQEGYAVFLGGLLVALGIWSLVGGGGGTFRPLMAWSQRRLSRSRGAAALGVLFGLSAPICAIPLLAALTGRALVGGPLIGFTSLGLFGLALSAPLVALGGMPAGERVLAAIHRFSKAMPVLAGGVLIALGGYAIAAGLLRPGP